MGAAHFLLASRCCASISRRYLDIGGGFSLRQVGAGDFLCFLKTTPQADDQCEILPRFGAGIRLCHRAPQRDFAFFRSFAEE